MQVRYGEAAAEEVQSIIRYLRERSPLVSKRFALELDALVGKLAVHPLFGYPVDDFFRKAELRTLPWSLVYRYDEDREIIWIMIVRHRLLRPTYGKDRRIPEE